MKTLSETVLIQLIQPRPNQSHKGTFGRVLLIGGNQQYGGAIIMSALACVASGAGLTTVVTAPQNHSALHTHCLEAMVIDWQQTEAVIEALNAADILLIGPGLGTDAIAVDLLKLVFTHQRSSQWLIIDGSAITLLAQFANKKAALLGAVYLHSYIGEAFAQKHYVVLPTTLSQQIPKYMKYFESLGKS